jgi:hypothetical protein
MIMENSENTPPMDLSQPDPALKRLEKLVGKWKLTGRTLSSNAELQAFDLHRGRGVRKLDHLWLPLRLFP